MGKPKGRKTKAEEDFSDEDPADVVAAAKNEGGDLPASKSNSKKSNAAARGKKKADKDEEDPASISGASGDDTPAAKLKSTKTNAKKSKADAVDKADLEVASSTKLSKQKSKKKYKGIDSEGEDSASDGDNNTSTKGAKNNSKKTKGDVKDDRLEKEEAAPAARASKQKSKKKQKDDESSDEDALVGQMGKLKLASASSVTSKGPGKQGFSALQADDASEEDESAAHFSKPSKKQLKPQPTKKPADCSDEEWDMDEPTKKGKTSIVQKRGFMMFDDDSTEEVAGSLSDKEEEDVKPKGDLPMASQKSKAKKDKKKEKKKDAKPEDVDIDAILASLDDKSGGGKNKKGKSTASKEAIDTAAAPPQAGAPIKEMTAEELADELESAQKKKKKGKKGEKESAAGTVAEATVTTVKEVTAEELADEMEADQKKKKKAVKKGDKSANAATEATTTTPAVDNTVQNATQKKDKEKPAAKKDSDKKPQALLPEATQEPVMPATQAAPEKEADKDAGEGPAEDSKKKKKKGKEKEEKKKPVNKRVEAMKEALAKLKEEEDRMRREAEEKERLAEEARLLREEQLRLEEERKQRKKQKEKEKIERKKKEGTFLTEKQKQDRKRAMQMIQAMGVAVPDRDAGPKKPVYGRQRKGKKLEPGEGPKEGGEEAEVADDEENDDNEEAKEAASVPGSGPVSVPVSVASTAAPAALESVAVVYHERSKSESEDLKEDWAASSEEEEDDDKKVEAPVVRQVSLAETAPVIQTPPAVVQKESDKKPVESEESSEEDDDDVEESDDEDEDEEEEEELTPKEKALARIMKRQEEAEKKRSTDRLRAAVVCVLGHVDTGKTKILDKLRHTNVQDNEAGGITQQIGATNVPQVAIQEQTKMCKEFIKQELRLPGLLIIDTPGHESFSNLRSRGSSLCDIAILVVDIMHGLEPQTIESINLLKQRKTPFIVALNKIDRLFQWKTNPHADVVNTIKKQQLNTKQEFDERAKGIIVQFAEQGLNAALFYENKNPREYVSLVPTSAHTGDGMGNLIALVCEVTQTYLAKRVALSADLRATVMEVKAIPGLGTTVDVILVDGCLRVGDIIVVPGIEGPIVTHVRELLLPQPMRELRVKGQYVHNKEVVAAQGVKIVAKDLEKALAGLPLYVAQQSDEVEVYKEWLSEALKNALNSIKCSERGVYVQSSTLGSLEALLEYLRSVKVPYSGINIGPVHKRDVMRASVMLEHGEVEHACILAFDVKVERDAQEMADSLGVRIFTADIIYHLFDAFQKYQDELIRRGREENKMIAVFPCKLRVLPQFVFNSRDPIVMGVAVEDGFICPGTPICVPSKEFVDLGVVSSVEFNHKPVESGKKGQEVCIKIDAIPGEAPKMFGRHFDEKDMLVSKISRNSIDAVKKYFKSDMSKDDWRLVIELKKIFDIV